MSDFEQIVPGVLISRHDRDARFTRGSLEGLALGVRNAVWKQIDLFQSTDAIMVYVGGNRKNSLDPPLDVAEGDTGRGRTLITLSELMRALQAVRTRNLPAGENSVRECDCDVYCDQAHGDGRLELRAMKPTFHELAAVAA